MTKTTFKIRNQKGLHCRFCNCEVSDLYENENLYETSPNKGIVCSHCKEHLEAYTRNQSDFDQLRKELKDNYSNIIEIIKTNCIKNHIIDETQHCYCDKIILILLNEIDKFSQSKEVKHDKNN